MGVIVAAVRDAFGLMLRLDAQLLEIVGLSLQGSRSAVAIATALALPLGVADAWREYQEQLRSLGAGGWTAALTLVWDIRFSLLTAVLAGLGRAAAEVGAVMIVGGNIDGVTRGMTTTIALQTSRGALPLALSLGLVLILLVIALNAGAVLVRDAA